jgi:hypothetical protein
VDEATRYAEVAGFEDVTATHWLTADPPNKDSQVITVRCRKTVGKPDSVWGDSRSAIKAQPLPPLLRIRTRVLIRKYTAMIAWRPLLKAILLNILTWILFLLLLLAFYFVWLREYQMTWGATYEDVSRTMAGDELLDHPELNATRAVEVRAPPEQIWPWLIQMGYKRAGFYGFDKLDNGGVASADHIIPEYQDLKVGDSIPGGESRGSLFHLLEVVEMEPNRSMLWVFVKHAGPWAGATWSWGLYRVDEQHTRLVARLRQQYTFDTLQDIVSWSIIDAIEILMMRTTLLGIKHRVEQDWISP